MKMILFALIIFATILQYVQCGTIFFFEGNSWKEKSYPKSLWWMPDKNPPKNKIHFDDHPLQNRANGVFRNLLHANTEEMKQENWTISVEKVIPFNSNSDKEYEEDDFNANTERRSGFVGIVFNDVYFSEKLGMTDHQLATLLGNRAFLTYLLG